MTPIPGTTRDILQEYIQIDGVPLHIIDTAGLRDSDDVVEQEGIRRALLALEKAQHILWLIDGAEESIEDIRVYLKTIPLEKRYHDRITFIYNKIDLREQSAKQYQQHGYTILCVSLKTGEGLTLLHQHLRSLLNLNDHEANFIARRRHLAALTTANTYLLKAEEALQKRLAGELLAEDLKAMQNSLNEITGEFTSDDLLGKIFSEFCIGK